MENKNQCFFSISLENGIVITGENPQKVKSFISELGIICTDALQTDNPVEWTGYVKELRKYFYKAWNIIYNNMKK